MKSIIALVLFASVASAEPQKPPFYWLSEGIGRIPTQRVQVEVVHPAEWYPLYLPQPDGSWSPTMIPLQPGQMPPTIIDRGPGLRPFVFPGITITPYRRR